jgi:hypothetical protein
MRRPFLFVVVLAATTSGATFASDRLSDRDVRALVERIDEGRDRFEDALDSQLKRSVMRGPSGELDVERFLDDFDKNIDRLKDRLKPDYSAGTDVAAVLHHASAIERYFRGQPSGTKGESEWNRLALDLKALAAAYGADFPLADNAPVRRMSDREVATALENVAESTALLKKSVDTDLKKDATLAKQSRQAIVREVDELGKDAKALRDRVEDGEPSSAEADRLLGRATKVKAFVDSHPVPTSASTWTSVVTRLKAVADAYGVSWPGNQ